MGCTSSSAPDKQGSVPPRQARPPEPPPRDAPSPPQPAAAAAPAAQQPPPSAAAAHHSAADEQKKRTRGDAEDPSVPTRRRSGGIRKEEHVHAVQEFQDQIQQANTQAATDAEDSDDHDELEVVVTQKRGTCAQTFGVEFRARGDAPLTVARVGGGGVAAQQGVERGMRLVCVNAVDVKSVRDADRALFNAPPDDEIVALFKRQASGPLQ